MSKIPDEAVHAAVEYYSEGGCMGLDSYERKEVAKSMLEAALPHLPLGFEVKKLEWVQTDKFGDWWHAETLLSENGFADYGIGKDAGYYFMVGDEPMAKSEKEENWDTVDEAKAAAQADFDRRVRECVVAKPVEVAAVRRQAFEEAARLVESSAYRSTTEGRSLVPCQFAKHDHHHATIASSLRALSSEPAQGEQWQPIETAPINQSILVHYDDGEIQLINDDDNDYAWVAYTGKQDFCTKPTHWMPLPAAPTLEEKE